MSSPKFSVLFAALCLNTVALAAEPRPSWRADWDKTVAAAEKEGLVSAYIFDSGPLSEETVQAFERAYPKIKVNQRGKGICQLAAIPRRANACAKGS